MVNGFNRNKTTTDIDKPKNPKIIRINSCDEFCPYYKETPVYDNSPDIRCTKIDPWLGGQSIPQFIETVDTNGWIHVGEYIGGEIPSWCPLEDA